MIAAKVVGMGKKGKSFRQGMEKKPNKVKLRAEGYSGETEKFRYIKR